MFEFASILFKYCISCSAVLPVTLLLVQNIRYETTACLLVLSCYDKQNERFIDVRINVFSDYKKQGGFYLSAKDLLNNRSYVPQKNYWKLSPAYSFIYNEKDEDYLNTECLLLLTKKPY